MTEQLTQSPVKPEVAATQQWIEEYVIANGFCPPLHRLTSRHRSPEGHVNWDAMTQHVVFSSLFDLQPDDPTFQQQVAAEYYGFVTDSLTRDDTPISRMLILPDLQSNTAFDWLVRDVQKDARKRLTTTAEGRALTDTAIRRKPLINGDAEETDYERAARVIVDTLIKPVQFYSLPLGEDPTRKQTLFTRDRIIYHAPHNTLQLLNTDYSEQVTGRLNSHKVWLGNFRRTEEIDLQQYKARVRQLRQGR